MSVPSSIPLSDSVEQALALSLGPTVSMLSYYFLLSDVEVERAFVGRIVSQPHLAQSSAA